MEGIIYKTSKYQENKVLLQVITPKGLVTLVASGALNLKSNIRYFCSFLNRISFEEKNKSMYTLVNANLIDDFHELKASLDKIPYIVYLFKVVSNLVDGFEVIYDILIDALKVENFYELIIQALLKILALSGYELNFIGSGQVIRGYSAKESSYVYENDDLKADLNASQTLALLNIYKGNFHNYEERMITKLFDFIKKYYSYHLEIN